MDSSFNAPASLRALLSDLIDYAGLFPPAGLPMRQAVENYARYLAGPDAWALARFVLPVSRFAEFEAAIADLKFPETWCISALVGTDADADLRAINEFNFRNTQRVDVDTIEVKAESIEAIHHISALTPRPIITYFEVPLQALEQQIPAVQEVDARAKIRAGGITADAFPATETVALFIVQCAQDQVAFKGTAGLHHPIRCCKPLTYEPNALTGTMHGFLNFLFAAALARKNESCTTIKAALEESDATAFRFEEASASWQEYSFLTEDLKSTRESFAISFGSCSFEEPLADLRELKLL